MALSQTIADAAGQAHGQFFAGLNPLDWAIVVLLAISAFTAFMRGLIRSLISIAGVVLGILLGAWYAPALAGMLLRWIPQPCVCGDHGIFTDSGWVLRAGHDHRPSIAHVPARRLGLDLPTGWVARLSAYCGLCCCWRR